MYIYVCVYIVCLFIYLYIYISINTTKAYKIIQVRSTLTFAKLIYAQRIHCMARLPRTIPSRPKQKKLQKSPKHQN